MPIKKISRYFFSSLMLLGVAAVMFTPNIPGFYRIDHYTLYLLFAYLGLGMLLLILGRKYTMITALACAGALALYLKGATNSKMRYAETKNATTLSIAHYNASAFNLGFNDAAQQILKQESDIISFQELTPDWNYFLNQTLEAAFPYKLNNVRIDPLGSVLYSKYPIEVADTIYHNAQPFLRAIIDLGENDYLDVIAVHMLPPLDQSSYDKLSSQLETILSTVTENINPKIVLGNFNISPWSKEIVQFKFKGQLDDSRRGIAPASLGGNFSPFRIPVNHMFHSFNLNCTDFKPLYDRDGAEVGIMGNFQVNQDNLTKTSQK